MPRKLRHGPAASGAAASAPLTAGFEKFFNPAASFASAEGLMRAYSEKLGFSSPAHVFLGQKKNQTEFLFNYCKAASEHGFSPQAIAASIIKWRYPAKLIGWKDVSSDQAAAAMVFAITSKVNWFDMLQDGQVLVENKALLNGVFGRRTTNFMDMSDAVGGVLYIINHAMHRSLPQAPAVMFCETAIHSSELDSKAAAVLKSCADFEKTIEKLISEDHWFKVSDKHHQNTVKFKLLCLVFDKEAGKLFVVREKGAPQPFNEWVGANMNDLLSLSNGSIARIKAFVEEKGGLLERMRGEGMNPWAYLGDEMKKREGIFLPLEGNGNDYKQAVKVWRYALMHLQAENVSSYEARWKEISEVESILKTHMKIACDDSRQSGDVKVLGSMITSSEFKRMFCTGNAQMKTLHFVPHHKCGFLTTMHRFHLALATFSRLVDEEQNPLAKQKASDFFASSMKKVLKNAKNGNYSSVCESLALADRMPKPIEAEMRLMLAGKPAVDKEMRECASTLYELFCSGNRLYRTVAFRAHNNYVLNHVKGKPGFVEVSAATKVYSDLAALGITGKLTFEQINSLINEKISRRMFKKCNDWAKANSVPFDIVFYMDTFDTGQAVEAPSKPLAREDYLNTVRYDYFFNPKNNIFTHAELQQLFSDFPLLKGRQAWELPK